ncbi:unnamed protein product [Darwinula stevensoni]|uniref:Iodothyronine deiodinase n=1 Tax=Darwinula stevensoni TaxID=69355 RepID=A0A7R8X373_9CRUS|nr:unnamed protein product [Darwinula stevensoni]CAG0878504.1 unnamed protein product [Darwinula stevensoni]
MRERDRAFLDTTLGAFAVHAPASRHAQTYYPGVGAHHGARKKKHWVRRRCQCLQCRFRCPTSSEDMAKILSVQAHRTEGTVKAQVEPKLRILVFGTLEDRIQAANYLKSVEDLPCPLLVDDITDEANSAFAAQPERLAIILNGTIQYLGGPGTFNYKVTDIEDWLQQYAKDKEVKKSK